MEQVHNPKLDYHHNQNPVMPSSSLKVRGPHDSASTIFSFQHVLVSFNNVPVRTRTHATSVAMAIACLGKPQSKGLGARSDCGFIRADVGALELMACMR